jgi:L-ribulose-5-phosphate 3-epimerase
MYFGYNTNGFAHHRLEDAIVILAEMGYQGIAITLDYHVLNPFDPRMPEQLQCIKELLKKYQMRSVIETGARFLLDPRKKHYPTLVDPLAYQDSRHQFLRQAVDIAAELGSDAVSFWSGSCDQNPPRPMAMNRLTKGVRSLCQYAQKKDVFLAFEPEPGMVIDTMKRFASLKKRLDKYSNFGLTLDIGHLQCQGEFPLRDYIVEWKDWLWNIHIEDMKQGIHDHLMFGEGEIDFAEVFGALHEINYPGGVFVELSRHSYNAVEVAKKSFAFLHQWNGK